MAIALLGSTALAQYSGLVTRSVCGGAGQPLQIGFYVEDCLAHWDVSLNQPWNTNSPVFHYAQAAEREVDEPTTITTTLHVYGALGGGGTGRAGLCATSRTFDTLGRVSATSAQVCTVGATLVNQDIITPSIPHKRRGQAATTVEILQDQWSSNFQEIDIHRVGWTFTIRSE